MTNTDEYIDINKVIDNIEQQEQDSDMHYSLFYVPDCEKEKDE